MNNLFRLDHRGYIDAVTNHIPGWLHDITALVSAQMLERQENFGIRGPLFEIGVFAGRYFSLLIRSGANAGDQVFGLDTFQFVALPAVIDHHLNHIHQPGIVTLITGRSRDFSAADLMARLAAPPRFVSIDGSHEKDDVLWDLGLADALLHEEGIVAVDDFLNPLTLGVNEAVNLFFAAKRQLAPFAYVQNKLFLCRPDRALAERAVLEASIIDSAEPRAIAWREAAAKDKGNVEGRMFGAVFTLVV
ncbi:MAG: class I SAM-dependent methyltransferase [Rhizobiales bacterium]|nr:class I SAM-dependent methyltransferase [Hyphomicrobiales bacterium]MBI3672497.1 class I SAM-dependent methyltransferase [Hyphomicrobiales bacterium]